MPRPFLAFLIGVAAAERPAPPKLLKGDLDAVYDLLDRQLPGQRGHFHFSFVESCPGAEAPCYHLAASGGDVAIAASGANELSAGLGHYLRDNCNMTIGWPRGGGSNVFVPAKGWPEFEATTQARIVPWSYAMNVCTHSYSLVWYDWKDWTSFLDWMALSGINNFLAMTGQEEVAYRVYEQFGLNDTEIRYWFNGPALLTWSRGQNEYGSNIAGPLPRSWMQDQWRLQKQILARARSLGMVGQLPAFQGNVPVALKYKLQDANMTDNKLGTAWIDALDPIFGQIADKWMETLIEDFGTDHWYQMDGYFNGGTAPWLSAEAPAGVSSISEDEPPPANLDWVARGKAAYGGLNRTDPEAIWSFQGWAFNGWKKRDQQASIRGFVEAVPPGKFSVIDMAYDGAGEWDDWTWDGEAFFGAPFIWTSLHNFGGSTRLRGSLARANEIPFAATDANLNVWGSGVTPEGIDQNPAFYDFLIGQNWRSARVPDIAAHMVERAHRRYGLDQPNEDVDAAWRLMTESSYTLDQWNMDYTGVGRFPGTNYDNYAWQHDSQLPATPTETMCTVWQSWGRLLAAGPAVSKGLEPFRYDVVNLGNEILSQISLPLSLDFAAAYGSASLDANRLQASGDAWMSVLADLDKLLATDPAFGVGGWIESARRLANGTDCDARLSGFPEIQDCAHMYEWNARTQITTWDPTPKGAAKPGKETVDYANKHWSGLIRDYYMKRVQVTLDQALKDAQAGRSLDSTAVDRVQATLAYDWTTAQNKYETESVGDFLEVSLQMHEAYKGYFASCGASAFV